MGALVPRSVGLTLSTSLFLGVTYRTSDGKGPKTTQGKRKTGTDGDPRALHQEGGGRGGKHPTYAHTAAAPGPLRLGQQDPQNTAPSEDTANSEHQTSKRTTTLGGLGPVWLLSVHVLTARPGPTSYFCFRRSKEGRGLCGRWRLELSFAGEWRGHKGRNRWGRGGRRAGGLGQRGQETKGQEKGAAFSSEEGTLHLA